MLDYTTRNTTGKCCTIGQEGCLYWHNKWSDQLRSHNCYTIKLYQIFIQLDMRMYSICTCDTSRLTYSDKIYKELQFVILDVPVLFWSILIQCNQTTCMHRPRYLYQPILVQLHKMYHCMFNVTIPVHTVEETWYWSQCVLCIRIITF